MDSNEVQLIGTPCGQHGPYTFYKAFKYSKNSVKRIVRLSEFFFVKLWSDSDLVCIGELQLLWVDKNSEQVLASLRLYFLPENTPEGRMDHGEDEVLAISEKVVLRVDDLVTWITVDTEWTWGRLAKCEADVKEPKPSEDDIRVPVLAENSLDFTDVEKERRLIDDKNTLGPSVVILSYAEYCRYRSMMKRLEGVEDEYLKHQIVKILGGFISPNRHTRILFCRDTFDYPELEGHELLCNHLAPKLKGRPRGKRKKRSLSPGSESNESESSVSNVFSAAKTKLLTEGNLNSLRMEQSPRRSTRSGSGANSINNNEGKNFLKKLHAFMKSNRTPIGRIPSLGYKELDLYSLYSKVDKLGGYDAVTSNRLWKSIFDDLSGNYASTSAATVIRRHFERFLLPYEQHIKGEDRKPLLASKHKKSRFYSESDAESSDGTSRSSSSTPIPSQTSSLTIIESESKDFNKSVKIKTEVKMSSLRSVRVKPDRLRDTVTKHKVGTIDKLLSRSETITNPSSDTIIIEIKSEVKTEVNVRDMRHGMSKNNLLGEPLNKKVSHLAEQEINTEKAATPIQLLKSEKLILPGQNATLEGSFSILSQKLPVENSGEKSLPVEGKENISNNSCRKDSIIDLTEVPYKSTTPEKASSESNNYSMNPANTINISILQSVKKQKLDILKEGGLEVTPIKSAMNPPQPKEIRPSVIHQPVTIQPANVGQISITLAKDKQSNSTLATKSSDSTKKNSQQPTTGQKSGISNTNPSKVLKKKQNVRETSTSFASDDSPPKVMQSKSIYSYSEKMVYGNPKEYFTPMTHIPYTPKFVESPVKQTGGDILDLTTKSPQKPVVEIMRIPNVPLNSRTPSNPRELSNKSTYRNTAAVPMLDGKLGSNLEITLVGPNSTPRNPYASKYHPSVSHGSMYQQGPIHNDYQKLVSNNSSYNSNNNYMMNHKMAQKRTSNGSFVAKPRTEMNGKLLHSMSQAQQYLARDNKNMNSETRIPNHYTNRNSFHKLDSNSTHLKSSSQNPSSNLKAYPSAPSPAVPGYLTQLSLASKMMPPYLHTMDPLYFSAMQSLYPQQVFPFAPVPTPEQLKLYSDLLAHNSPVRFPYPFPQGSNTSMATTNSETNNYKKQ